MPNFIPYLLLTAVCAVALISLLIRKRDVWPLIVLLSFSGTIYVFEFFIMVLFDSYRYHPNIVKIPYYDNVVGALVSNFFAVPVAAVFVVVYRLRAPWILSLALAFGAIEWLFLRIGAFEHQWWRTPYTILALLIFFPVARLWLAELRRGRSPFTFVALQMLAWSIAGTTMFGFALSGVRLFQSGVFDDPYRDDIFLSSIYGSYLATILAAAMYRSRSAWRGAAAFLLILTTNFALIRFGYLRIMLPMWQYWLLYSLCLLTILLLVAAAGRKLERLKSMS